MRDGSSLNKKQKAAISVSKHWKKGQNTGRREDLVFVLKKSRRTFVYSTIINGKSSRK